MSAKAKEVYKITALSNMHVGSGDQNYGIVDKLVQRDTITGFPTIHSSSLKGALKVYCQEVLKIEGNDPLLINSFGDEFNQGNDNYFSAHLLTIPVRGDFRPYYRATCPTILKEFREQLKVFGVAPDNNYVTAIDELILICKNIENKFIVFSDIENSLIEDYLLDEATIHNMKDGFSRLIENTLKYTKEEFVIIRDDIFMEISENLPVVARNRLGEHKNLWYEEVVPRLTEFYFFYLGEEKNKNGIIDEIVTRSSEDIPFQIGANATVGYGYCKINKMSSL